MNEEKPKTYECVCFKCGESYQSTDENDLDGDGTCLPCTKELKRIAKEVDKKMEILRRERPTAVYQNPLDKYFTVNEKRA